MLIDRPVEVDPPSGYLDVGLIHEPPIPGAVPTGPGGVDELRRECLHPAIDRDVVDFDAALGKQLLDVTVGQPVAQVPSHGERDHLTRKTVARGRRRQHGFRSDHRFSLPGAERPPSTQQSLRGVFGSVARGDDNDDSDIDLLVDLPPEMGLVRLGRLQRDLETLLTPGSTSSPKPTSNTECG